MRIGVLKERLDGETRVSLAPYAVNELTGAGHRVMVEAGAGEDSTLSDEQYREAGALVVEEAEKVYGESELIVKVYGPRPDEFRHLREDMMILSFLSLPVQTELMDALLASRCIAFASEGIRDARGQLPILTPMSEIGGRLVPQIGAHYLQHQSGGRGILLGGAVGVRPGRVLILGAGIVGSAAARVSSGLGAEVTIFDRDLDRLRATESRRLRNVTTIAASELAIREAALEADLVIGAIHIASSRTPALIDRSTVEEMKPRAVIVDVDVDNGGCIATSRPTSLDAPTFVDHGVTHYCVGNIPALVPSTSSRALSNALLPYVRRIAGLGLSDSLNADPGLKAGVVVAEGRVTDPILARNTGREHTSVSAVIPLHPEVR